MLCPSTAKDAPLATHLFLDQLGGRLDNDDARIIPHRQDSELIEVAKDLHTVGVHLSDLVQEGPESDGDGYCLKRTKDKGPRFTNLESRYGTTANINVLKKQTLDRLANPLHGNSTLLALSPRTRRRREKRLVEEELMYKRAMRAKQKQHTDKQRAVSRGSMTSSRSSNSSSPKNQTKDQLLLMQQQREKELQEEQKQRLQQAKVARERNRRRGIRQINGRVDKAGSTTSEADTNSVTSSDSQASTHSHATMPASFSRRTMLAPVGSVLKAEQMKQMTSVRKSRSRSRSRSRRRRKGNRSKHSDVGAEDRSDVGSVHMDGAGSESGSGGLMDLTEMIQREGEGGSSTEPVSSEVGSVNDLGRANDRSTDHGSNEDDDGEPDGTFITGMLFSSPRASLSPSPKHKHKHAHGHAGTQKEVQVEATAKKERDMVDRARARARARAQRPLADVEAEVLRDAKMMPNPNLNSNAKVQLQQTQELKRRLKMELKMRGGRKQKQKQRQKQRKNGRDEACHGYEQRQGQGRLASSLAYSRSCPECVAHAGAAGSSGSSSTSSSGSSSSSTSGSSSSNSRSITSRSTKPPNPCTVVATMHSSTKAAIAAMVAESCGSGSGSGKSSSTSRSNRAVRAVQVERQKVHNTSSRPEPKTKAHVYRGTLGVGSKTSEATAGGNQGLMKLPMDEGKHLGPCDAAASRILALSVSSPSLSVDSSVSASPTTGNVSPGLSRLQRARLQRQIQRGTSHMA